jgi:4-amino-4-deoxy-L-arabinose transferase-like glycosyltransferase
MAAVIGFERWVLPGDDVPSVDREVGLLRAVDVALLAALPLLAWATARRLGGSDRAGVVAALATLCLPQLVHIGAAVNNDNLFVLLGGLLAALLAGVARGQAGRRTDLAVGVVLGLALLTKAFAVMFVPWVAAAYAVGAVTTRSRRRAIVGGAVALGVGAVLGGWWWVGNWLREGQPAPTTESLTRTLAERPRGFSPDAVVFAWTFTGRLVTRTWAWVGFGKGKFDLPVAVVAVGTTAFLAATAVALVTARRGTAPGGGLRRVDVVLAWLATILVAAFVARRAWGLYVTTGRFAFVQGRYLFGTIVGPMAVAAIGAVRLHRRAPVAVVAGAIVVQGWVLRDVIAGAWSGDGRAGAIDGMLAWSPWPAAAVAAVAAVGAAALVALVVECWRVSAGGQPSPTNPSGGPIGRSSAGAGTMRKMR